MVPAVPGDSPRSFPLAGVAKSDRKKGLPARDNQWFEQREERRAPGIGSGTEHCRRVGRMVLLRRQASVRDDFFSISGGPFSSWAARNGLTIGATTTGDLQTDSMGGCVFVTPQLAGPGRKLSKKGKSILRFPKLSGLPATRSVESPHNRARRSLSTSRFWPHFLWGLPPNSSAWFQF